MSLGGASIVLFEVKKKQIFVLLLLLLLLFCLVIISVYNSFLVTD